MRGTFLAFLLVFELLLGFPPSLMPEIEHFNYFQIHCHSFKLANT